MINRIFFAILLAVAVLAAGCEKQTVAEGTVIRATVDEASRTALDGVKVLWSEGDAIVVNGAASTSTTLKDGGRSAEFTFAGTLSAPYYALSPASGYVSGSYVPSSGRYGSIVLPAEQSWTEGSFDPSAALMYGYSASTSDVNFHLGASFIRFTISGGDNAQPIKRIEVSSLGSEDMSGKFILKAGPVLEMSTAVHTGGVVLRSEGGIPLGASVIVAIAPQTYASGIRVRIVDELNHFQDIRSTRSFTAAAGTVYNTSLTFVPTGTLVEGDAENTGGEEELPVETSTTVRVGIMGDSISTFKGWIPSNFAAYYPHTNTTTGNALLDVTETWWYRLIYDLMPEATLDRNLSYSGSFVTKIDDGKARDEWTFPTRCAMYEDPDIVIIHGGTNDRGVSRGAMVPLGTYDYDTPVDELDIRAFRSAYIKTILQLQANYPGVQIVCLINSVLYKENTTDETKNYIRLSQSIQAIADHYGLPVVSLKDVTYGTLDGLHPDPDGSLVIANIVYNRLAQENLLHYKRPRN